MRPYPLLAVFLTIGALLSLAASTTGIPAGNGLPAQLGQASSLSPDQLAAIIILGIIVAVLVLAVGLSLFVYFTEGGLRRSFPDEYVRKNETFQGDADDEPYLPAPGRWMPRLALSVLAGLVLAGIGYGVMRFFNDGLPLTPIAASLEAVRIDSLFDAMMVIMVMIFVLVWGALIVAALRFRAKPDDLTDAAPIHGNNTLEILWTVAPALIVVWLAFASFNVLDDIQDTRAGDMTVIVTGYQFGWEYYYPELDYTSYDALYLPAYQDVRLVLRSRDVIHAYWVPAFRLKRDAMPNIDTEMYVTPIEVGRYPVLCAELCGVGHSLMLGEVVVMDDLEYAAWARTNSQVVEIDPNDPIAVGRQLYGQYGCSGCHILDDVGAVGQVGPNQNGIAVTAAERVPGLSAEDYLRQSIYEPNAYIVDGYSENIMPQNFSETMPEADLEALVTYMLLVGE